MDLQQQLAELLFPHITKTPADYEALYPPRSLPEGARVTRFAPSPTGFLHMGSLYPSFLNQWMAHASGGVFYLRIEDTDAKREVKDGVAEIVNGLREFDIIPDEGPLPDGTEQGAYGPYSQRPRKDIYQCYAKELVKQGLAYPCFCTPEELEALRAEQEAQNVNKGYYGQWASCRSLSFAAQQEAIAAGRPYVLRLRSNGSGKVTIEDLIRGKIEMPANEMDAVLLKTDGIPTYHFAHAVDDHLMRTTHVIRGDEWIASVPLHLELFRVLGFKPPKYAHIAPLMKEDNGGKRKLSKRKDPEAAVSYFVREGYPAQAVHEYLATLANSNFEEWRKANPTAPRDSFMLNFKKMSASGALFDLVKLVDVSKNYISHMPAQAVYEQTLAWAKQFDADLAALLERDPGYAKCIFAIDRDVPKPRKDIAKWGDVRDYCAYFFDTCFSGTFTLPEQLAPADAAAILEAYAAQYNDAHDRDGWFNHMKALCEPLGFTPNVKEYKQNPAAYKGHIGDVSAVIRLAVTGRQNSPDLYSILQLLGRERVVKRLLQAREKLA